MVVFSRGALEDSFPPSWLPQSQAKVSFRDRKKVSIDFAVKSVDVYEYFARLRRW
jgi:hypothetical protein